jgi:hypothetical protein
VIQTAKTWRGRLGAILLGTIAGLGLIEAGLRVAAAVEADATLRRSAGTGGARPLVAFVGDSNVYGVYVKDEETLPKAVEALTSLGFTASTAPDAPASREIASRAAASTRGVRTVNLGVPGAASWFAVEQCERALRMGPAAVFCRVGFNNLAQNPPEDAIPVFDDLRLVKLVRICLFNLAVRRGSAKVSPLNLGPDGTALAGETIRTGQSTGLQAVQDRTGTGAAFEILWMGKTLTLADAAPRLREDWLRMKSACQARGVPFVMMTYLAALIGEPFRTLRQMALDFAKEHGVPVVDCTLELPTHLQPKNVPFDGPATPEQLQSVRGLVLFDDKHATPVGYELEARAVARTLHQLGLLTEPPLDNGRDVVKCHLAEIPLLAGPEREGGAVTGRGEPRDEFVVYFGTPGRGFADGMPLPIDVKGEPEKAYANEAGWIRVRPESVAPGATHAAAIIHRGPKAGWRRTFVSDAVRLRP